MKLISRICAVLLTAGVVMAAAVAADRPNVVIILADDLGYGDLGCYGSPNIETPNLDRMAREGIRLSSFYAAPVCSPSRSQIMTGCYATRVSNARNPFPHSNWGLNPSEITVAEALKRAGYSTLCIGKWHLGDAPEFLPTRQGFDHYFGIPFSNDMWRFHPMMPVHENEEPMMTQMRARAAYTGFMGEGTYWPPGVLENDLPLMRDEQVIEKAPDQRQLTTRYTEEALKFIDAKRHGPFFLYLAMHVPHVPLFVSEKFAGKSRRGLYGDCVMELDWGVGEVLKRLKQDGIDDKTLVIFMSDNGPWLEYGVDGGSAGPLRGGKVSTWEGGERVPAIFRWPGKIPANRRNGSVIPNMDLFPTLAGLAGVPVPSDRVIDGLDIWPLLSGSTETGPHQYFQFLAGSAPGKINYCGIRDQQWKLVLKVDPAGRVKPLELYDLGADVGEKFDRIKQQPAIASRLRDAAQVFYDELRVHIRPPGKISRPGYTAGPGRQ
jgi:arylsulfatase A